MRLNIILAGLVLSFAAVPVSLRATDGYFSNGYGTQCKAMAGACAARAQDALAAANNPAAMFWAGHRYDLGLNFFRPIRSFSVEGAPSGAPGTFGLAPGTVESGSRLFLIPSFGANWRLGGNTSFGITLYGNGGMNTNYDAAVFGSRPAGVNLMQMFIVPTLARRVAGKHSLGVSPILAWQRFKAEGLAAFAPFSSAPAALSNQGYAQAPGIGLKAGYLGELQSWLSVGAYYQSRVRMGKFDRYRGLFAEQGGFDIPASYTAGVVVRPHSRVSLSADAQRILYSTVRSVGNPLLPNLMRARLGDAGGPGFGWKDITVARFGAEVSADRLWRLRGGFSTAGQPIPSSEVLFNVLAPGVIQRHVSAGLTRVLPGGRAFHLAVVRAFENSVRGPNPLEAPGRQHIRLKMHQWEFEVGFSFGLER
jgi:long-chain fatty acid transport protein